MTTTHLQKRSGDTLERINRQIMHVEQTISDLLSGVELSELTNVERLNFAIKLMTLHQRALTLRISCEATEGPAQQDTVLLTTLMRKMRGEPVELAEPEDHEEGGVNG